MILRPDGNPLNPQKPESLPLMIEATIEAKVNTAMDRMREDNRQYRRDASIRGWIKYGIWSIAAVSLFVLIDLYGSDKVEEWTKKYVNEKMNQPMIEKEADKIMQDRMSAYIDGKIATITEDLTLLDKGIKRSESSMQQLSVDVNEAFQALELLKSDQEFFSLVHRAENYEYEAVMELKRISQDNSKFSNEASRVILNVENKLEYDRVSIIERVPKELLGNNEYVGPFTNDEIYDRIKIFKNDQRAAQSIANYVRHGDVKVFMKELVDIAINEKRDLFTLNRVTHAISHLSGNKFNLWDMQPLKVWWDVNQINYRDWPHENYDIGINLFEHANYFGALESFKKVLEVDSDADKSRALAIACAIEIGDNELANTLFESFKGKDNRWAKWARTKITLAIDGSERATEMLASLSKEYRTFPMRAFISPTAHVWRQIDWSQYDTLVKDENK